MAASVISPRRSLRRTEGSDVPSPCYIRAQRTPNLICRRPMTSKSSEDIERIPPPVAPRIPHRFTRHGITISDDYAWLKDANWQAVLRDPSLLDSNIRTY